MNPVDAMKQALEALKGHEHAELCHTLRLAIEQAEKQEPVAWLAESENYREAITTNEDHAQKIAAGHNASIRPLYTAPPQRRPLTEEEIMKACGASGDSTPVVLLARAIERKHDIK